MRSQNLQPGDWVIYQKQKFSESPGKRAQALNPASAGDSYSYVVAKFWVVKELMDENSVLLCTRRGKEHVVKMSDPNLRRANWWERFRHRRRFLDVAHSDDEDVTS